MIKGTRPILRPPPAMIQILKELRAAVGAGQRKLARTLAEEAFGRGIPPLEIVTDAMMPAMADVGERFKCNLIFVP